MGKNETIMSSMLHRTHTGSKLLSGMRKMYDEPVEQSSQYVGGVPVTTVIKMNDCAIHIGVSGIGLEENKYKP